jgi:EAL domain-containing protein (putative c-di-GMP-specific phosphodiesterase class I)
MQSRLHWEEMINRSLPMLACIVHYQPILDIRAAEVSHYEALVRMRSADGSPIPPGLFMEVAENSGLIRDIDRYVIHQVFDKMLALFAAGQALQVLDQSVRRQHQRCTAAVLHPRRAFA